MGLFFPPVAQGCVIYSVRSPMLLLFVQESCNPRFSCPIPLLLWLLSECAAHVKITSWRPTKGKQRLNGLDGCSWELVNDKVALAFLRADLGWFVLSAKCQSVFAKLSHMISLNTQDWVVHLVGSWELSQSPSPSPPLTPTSASLCLGVLAFYLPPRGYEKGPTKLSIIFPYCQIFGSV